VLLRQNIHCGFILRAHSDRFSFDACLDQLHQFFQVMKPARHLKQRVALIPALLLAWSCATGSTSAQSCATLPSERVTWWSAEGSAVDVQDTTVTSVANFFGGLFGGH
jgi:hypothetical protein